MCLCIQGHYMHYTNAVFIFIFFKLHNRVTYTKQSVNWEHETVLLTATFCASPALLVAVWHEVPRASPTRSATSRAMRFQTNWLSLNYSRSWRIATTTRCSTTTSICFQTNSPNHCRHSQKSQTG